MSVKELLDEFLPGDRSDVIIKAARIVKLLQTGPTGDPDEDALINKIFEIGLEAVKDEVCRRCKGKNNDNS
jgi:hypothetical protein